jgi:Flp pilus assembly protein TadD
MHAELGIALHRSGHPDEAATELRQALALEPKLVPARAELEQILAEQGPRKPALGN